jgi:ribosomal protein S15P/S13E
MKDIAKTLLGLGITVGLSDRETFVNQVSTIIKEYQKDPEKADKWADGVITYLEQKRDSYNMHSTIKEAVIEGLASNKDIEALTNAIKELTEELKNHKR